MIKKLQILIFSYISFVGILSAQVTCPTDITQSTDLDICGAVVSFDFGVDPLEYNITLLSGLASGSEFPLGTTQNVFEIQNLIGESDTCSFLVTIVDQTPPNFDCPETIMVPTDINTCGAIVNFDTPSVNDNCNTGTTVLAQNNSDIVSGGSPYSCPGSLVSHLRVFDLSAMGVVGDFIISNVEIGVGYSNENQEATMKIYTLNGDLLYQNMTLVTEVTTTIPNLNSELFQFPITATVPDSAVIVVEYIPTDNRLVGYNTSGGQTAPSYVSSPGAECLVTEPTNLETVGETGFSLIMKVNGGNFTVSQTAGLPTGSLFPLGTTVNTFVATDAAGNSSQCSFEVIVSDQQAPIIECPGLMTVPNDEGSCGAIVEYDLTVHDNCPDYSIIQLTGLPSGSAFPIGTTLNTFIVSDNADNSDTCSFEVVVTDNSKPTFVLCPDNIVVDVDPLQCGAVVDFSIEAEDACSDLPVPITQLKGLASGSLFPIGTTAMKFQATDISGNKAFCEFTVTVNGNSTATFENCPEDIITKIDTGCSAIVEYDLPQLGGGCSSFTSHLKHNNVDSVAFAWADCSTNGSKHLRVFNLPDMGINGTFDVNSISVGVGYVSTPTDITLNLYTLTGNLEYSNMTMIGTVVKNITPNLNNEVIQVPISAIVPANSVLVAEYVVPAHADAAHIAGYNNGTQNGESYYSAPDCDIIEPIALSSTGQNQSLVLVVSGSYELAQSIEQIKGLPSGSNFPVGETENVFVTAGDTCSFIVNVADVTPPTISECENIDAYVSENSCTVTMELPQPQVSDNCEIASITNDHSEGQFELGLNTVTWTVTDISGNTNTCSFDVNVKDTIAPKIKCRDINLKIEGSACDTLYTLENPEVTENCTLDTIYNDFTDLVFPIGETTVTWTAIDESGNSSTCSSKVIVTSDFTPNVDNAVVTNIDCNGNANGSIALNLNDPNIDILWSNEQTTEEISDLAAGEYKVSLTVAACPNIASTYSFEITEPTPMVLDTAIITPETNGQGNGAINLQISGGTPPYSNNNLADLAMGDYTIDVTDSNGCVAIFGPYTIDNIVGTEDLGIFENINIQPNPANKYTVLSYHLAKAGVSEVKIYSTTGKEVWSKNFSSSTKNSVRLETSSWSKGLYLIHLKSGSSNTVQKLIIE